MTPSISSMATRPIPITPRNASRPRWMPERAGRFLAFLYPEQYPKDAYQQVQGLIAFGSGGAWGLGLGNGRQKFAYLPYAHTDFIFPMVGEEMGLPFTLGVVFCFLLLLTAGVLIANQRTRLPMPG